MTEARDEALGPVLARHDVGANAVLGERLRGGRPDRGDTTTADPCPGMTPRGQTSVDHRDAVHAGEDHPCEAVEGVERVVQRLPRRWWIDGDRRSGQHPRPLRLEQVHEALRLCGRPRDHDRPTLQRPHLRRRRYPRHLTPRLRLSVMSIMALFRTLGLSSSSHRLRTWYQRDHPGRAPIQERVG